MHPADETTRLKRQRAKDAIQLALQNRWEDAAQANLSIIETFPNDVNAYNRLGKALTELGRYDEAWKAYGHALALEPTNSIARKNLDRLTNLKKTSTSRTEKAQRLDPQIFIAEMGKTGLTVLQNVAQQAVMRMAAGDPVQLRPDANTLAAESGGGEYLGEVEPKLALRLVKLIEGGNRYAAAITDVKDGNCRVIIKEVYQHPTQIGRLSFPTATTTKEGIRPYVKTSLVRRDVGSATEEGSAEEEWEGEIEAQQGDIHLSEAAEAEEENEESDD